MMDADTLRIAMYPGEVNQPRCDADDIADGKFEVLTKKGPLYFCAHHWIQYRDVLRADPKVMT